ncbi:MAG: IclR family transcriptional regulator [Firmicutes bacterium]|nr:IclR family transcriptional regulator [Bacillota bacterium]
MNNTILRAMQILNYIGDCSDGVTLQSIANQFSIPKSSAYVIVQSMLELGYIEPSPYNNKRYCLGIKAFTLGMKYANNMDWVHQCSTYLNPLADKYNKTGFVSVLNGSMIVYVGKYVAPNAVLTSCPLGSRKASYATAAGKAILAFLPQQELDQVLDSMQFEPLAERTITSKECLLPELEEIRRKGYAQARREDSNISCCCGAPVFDYTGRVIGGISLTDVYHPEYDDDLVAADLLEASRKISHNLGYQGR